MTSLSVTPEDGEGQVLGKTVSELQDGVSITGEKISGTLRYIKGWTNFQPSDNDGNFLALKVDYPEDAEVKFTLVGGTTKDKKFPKNDHSLVVRVKDAASQKLAITITHDGQSATATYDLSGLKLDPAGDL